MGRALRAPAVLALRGDVGAGKTAFVRGLARGLRAVGPVTSPTFALAHEHPGPLPLFHFDLYRLSGPEDLFDIGWEDYLARGGVCAIEWSERAEGALPPDTLYVTLDSHPDNPDWRILTCDHPGL
jgi:tRNA threonylcarbamoyladenosine biosynthesis protein TsaE